MNEKISYEELQRRVRELEETLERFSRREQSIQGRLDHLTKLNQIDEALRCSGDLDIILWEVMGSVLEVFRCDRAWLVYPCDPEAPRWEIRMERTTPEYPGGKERPGGEFPTTELAESFRKALQSPGPVVYGPEGYAVSAFAKKWRVQSQLFMALRPNRDSPWLFGIHQCSYPRAWSPEEKGLFQEAGYRITNALNLLAAAAGGNDHAGGSSPPEAQKLEELRATHASLQALVDHTDDFALVSDGQGRPVIWNRAYAAVMKELLGIDMEPGLQPHKLLEDPKAVAWWDGVHRRALEGERFRVNYVHGEAPDARHFEVSFTPIREAGEVVGFTELTRDITERCRYEKALRENEMRYRELVATLPLGIAEIGTDGTIVFSNRAHDAIYGYEHGVLEGRNVSALLQNERDGVRLLAYFRELADKEPPVVPWAGVGRRRDESLVDIRVDWNYRRSANGEVEGFSAIVTDVTERRQAQKALQDSEEKFRKFAEESPSMILIESENRIVYVNRQCELRLGLGRMDYSTTAFSFEELVVPEEREEAAAARRRLLEGGGGEEFDCRLAGVSKGMLDVIVSSRLISYRGGRAILRIITDITERRKAEKALRESEERYRNLVEHSHEVIFTLDREGRFVQLNRAFEDVTGWSVGEWMGRHFNDLVHPDDHRMLAERFAALSVGEKLPQNEIRILSKSGDVLAIEYSSVPVMTGGVLEGVRGIARDVTTRRRAEEDRRSLIALREREGVSRWLHDHLGADLYNIVLLTDSIQRKGSVAPAVEQQLGWIAETSRNALASIRNYLDFAGSAGRDFTELVRTIEEYGASVLKPLDIGFNLERRGALGSVRLTAIQSFNVYLIFKEALTNIVKHAGASQVSVKVALEDAALSMVIEDNGKGAASGESTRGYGRMNIRARAEELGAGLAVTSSQEGGTRVALTFVVPC